MFILHWIMFILDCVSLIMRFRSMSASPIGA